jgi:hypothetical protein
MTINQISQEDQEGQDHAHTWARWILKNRSPRDYILSVFKTLHIGDIDTGEGILVGTMNQSISNSKGLQSTVHGESGYGKSHAARAMLHLHPEKYYLITSLTDKALFYMEADDLLPGMTIFCDDADISPGIEGIIKRSTSAFQEETEHRVPQKEAGVLKTKKLSIPPRINWLLTSVDSQGSDQFVKRQISYGIDDSTQQDEQVINFELEKAQTGLSEFPINDDVLICREIITMLKENKEGKQRLSTVKIPFADRIEWRDKTNRRNLPIFLDMVRGYAALNVLQREHDDEGSIIANEDDFRAAERLYNSRGGFQKLHITEREKEMVQYIANDGGELGTNELTALMKLSDRRVCQIGDRLRTLLPGFHIEKRSVSVVDPHEDTKRTVTHRNYFCYPGEVNLELFDSVVSLKPRKPPLRDMGKKENIPRAPEAHEEHSNSTRRGVGLRVEEAQNERPKANELYNNKINNNNIPNEGYTSERVKGGSSSLYILENISGGQEKEASKAKKEPISEKNDGDEL